MVADWRPALRAAWRATGALEKCAGVDALIPTYLALGAAATEVNFCAAADAPPCAEVGRPERPICVPPAELPRRRAVDQAGRAALLHAIAHIEFNAINLALDAAWRFSQLGGLFVRDWIGVAIEEAYHFRLIHDQLERLDVRYGDLPAHAGLWQLAEQTEGDVLARMALVPRLMEARGLDAMPPIFRSFQGVGDRPSLRALAVIARDEVRHVAVGDFWFRHGCAAAGLPVEETFRALIAQHNAPWPKAPLNEAARRAAGFANDELMALRG